MGFEPTRAEPIGLAVQRLNHSATSSYVKRTTRIGYLCVELDGTKKKRLLFLREFNVVSVVLFTFYKAFLTP